jgi:ribosomal-protein-alanine N-acetyltransferase
VLLEIFLEAILVAETKTLSPGSLIPIWAERIEVKEFGASWGPVEDREIIWLLDELAFARWRAIPEIGEAELLRIAVSYKHRRQGHARKLMQDSSKHLYEIGCKLLRLEVRASNAPAKKMYESLGWRVQGIRKAYYGDGEDAAVYELIPVSSYQ